MVEVVATDEFAAWYRSLRAPDMEAVTESVEVLAEKGVDLGYPYSSAVEGSRYPLRELRIQSRGKPFRLFYAFDPRRHAVLLIGGDKTGKDRFYKVFVPRAERIWEGYLAEQAAGLHDDGMSRRTP